MRSECRVHRQALGVPIAGGPPSMRGAERSPTSAQVPRAGPHGPGGGHSADTSRRWPPRGPSTASARAPPARCGGLPPKCAPGTGWCRLAFREQAAALPRGVPLRAARSGAGAFVARGFLDVFHEAHTFPTNTNDMNFRPESASRAVCESHARAHQWNHVAPLIRGVGGRWCTNTGPESSRAPNLAACRVDGPRFRHEVQSPSQVQDQIPSEQLGGVRPSPGPARRCHSVDLSRCHRVLETGTLRLARSPEEVL